MKHAVILLLASLAIAQTPSDKDKRRPHKWLPVDLPWEHLELAKGVEVAEAPRSLLEAFPYLLASRDPKPLEGYHLTAGNLHHFLKGPISSGEQAFEAARTFVAGPLVTTAEAAERVVGLAKEQPQSLGIKIHDYRPKVYAPVIARAKDGWEVSFVAYEMVGRARLVHVAARVPEKGEITYAFQPIVDGPQLSWQTAGEVDMEEENRKRAQARAAMMLFGKALHLEPGIDTAWALARVALKSIDEVSTLLGKPSRKWTPIAALSNYVVGDSTITFASARADEPEDPEPIVHVGRMWTEMRGKERVTYTHGYFFAPRPKEKVRRRRRSK
jgi:hypothetical protein